MPIVLVSAAEVTEKIFGTTPLFWLAAAGQLAPEVLRHLLHPLALWFAGLGGAVLLLGWSLSARMSAVERGIKALVLDREKQNAT